MAAVLQSWWPVSRARDRSEHQNRSSVVGERERRVVERLQQRAGDQVRLAMAALARPGVQRQLVLLARFAASGEIVDARLAERDVGNAAPRGGSSYTLGPPSRALSVPSTDRASWIAARNAVADAVDMLVSLQS